MTSVVIGVSSIGASRALGLRLCASRLRDNLPALRGIEARLPLTRSPIAPVRDGPRMVVVYLRFAPGKPECLLRTVGADSSSEGVGEVGMATSGQRSTSARPDASM